MPQIIGVSESFNCPQYSGELFSADTTFTPLLSMIGGLTGGKQTFNDEFSTAVLYDYPLPKQPSISETDSIIAPPASFLSKTQDKNVVQIFQDTIQMTYARQANSGKMWGINQAADNPNPPSELDWQIEQKLKTIARDVEYTFIRGSYARALGPNLPNKTRGLIELCDANTIDAAGVALDKTLLKKLFKEMADSGAYLTNMVMFVNSAQKEALTEIYANQPSFALPASRNVGGVNIREIETDFFNFGIVYDKFVPEDTILLVDVAHLSPVFQTVPKKGNFFLEELSKTGASDTFQLYGQIGLAHGPAFLHGTITDLKF